MRIQSLTSRYLHNMTMHVILIRAGRHRLLAVPDKHALDGKYAPSSSSLWKIAKVGERISSPLWIVTLDEFDWSCGISIQY